MLAQPGVIQADPRVFHPSHPALTGSRFQLSRLLLWIGQIFPDQTRLQWLIQSFAAGFMCLITQQALARSAFQPSSQAPLLFRASRQPAEEKEQRALDKEIANEEKSGRTARVADLQPAGSASDVETKDYAAKAVHQLVSKELTALPEEAKGSPEQRMFCSPVSVIPKKKCGVPIEGKYRLIHNLSAGDDQSSNADVAAAEAEAEFKFPALDQICAMITAFGKGCIFWKLDLAHAYRNIPTHPSMWARFCFVINGSLFLDTRLPFGLRSAPFIFCKFMSIVVWTIAFVIGSESLFAYIDDIIALEAPSYFSAALLRFQLAKTVLLLLGMDLSEKILPPCTCGEILGIIVDTTAFTLSIPHERIQLMQQRLAQVLNRASLSRKEAESLVGSLKYFARVMRPARIFIARLIRFMYSIHGHPAAQVTLTPLLQQDIVWWHERVERLNGTHHFYEKDRLASAAHFYADACADGFACVYGNRFYYRAWTEAQRAIVLRNMAIGECYAITCAAAIFARDLRDKCFVLHSDSMDTVEVITRYYARDPALAEIVRTLAALECDNHFSFSIVHISGELNWIADSLSRLDFLRLQRLLGLEAASALQRIIVSEETLPCFPLPS